MPYPATVFNVLIASPGDVQLERNIVRDVVHEWNAAHSLARKIVMQPVGWETNSVPAMGERPQGVLNKQLVDGADLLVAIFWTRIGTPTGEAAGGSVEEVNRHVKAGKPAMVYFSSAPVRPDSVNDEQYKALTAFKKECYAQGLVQEYESATDFRQKFQRQLASMINTEGYFAVAEAEPNGASAAPPEREVPTLGKEARALLLEAVEDKHGQVIRVRLLGGLEIQANGKQFVEKGNPRSRAAWEGALTELANLGYLEGLGEKGQIFQVTQRGYEMAELLRP